MVGRAYYSRHLTGWKESESIFSPTDLSALNSIKYATNIEPLEAITLHIKWKAGFVASLLSNSCTLIMPLNGFICTVLWLKSVWLPWDTTVCLIQGICT